MSTINVYNYFENETYNWFFSTHGILKGGHIFNSKSLSLSAKEAGYILCWQLLLVTHNYSSDISLVPYGFDRDMAD